MLECALSSAHLLHSRLFSAEDSGRYSHRSFSHKRGQHADFEMIGENHARQSAHRHQRLELQKLAQGFLRRYAAETMARSEEHTSELQSHSDLVCRLLLEKKKKKKQYKR